MNLPKIDNADMDPSGLQTSSHSSSDESQDYGKEYYYYKKDLNKSLVSEFHNNSTVSYISSVIDVDLRTQYDRLWSDNILLKKHLDKLKNQFKDLEKSGQVESDRKKNDLSRLETYEPAYQQSQSKISEEQIHSDQYKNMQKRIGESADFSKSQSSLLRRNVARMDKRIKKARDYEEKLLRQTSRAKHDLNFTKESLKEIQASQIMKLRERENYLKAMRGQLESWFDSYSVKSYNQTNIQKRIDELENQEAEKNSVRYKQEQDRLAMEQITNNRANQLQRVIQCFGSTESSKITKLYSLAMFKNGSLSNQLEELNICRSKLQYKVEKLKGQVCKLSKSIMPKSTYSKQLSQVKRAENFSNKKRRSKIRRKIKKDKLTNTRNTMINVVMGLMSFFRKLTIRDEIKLFGPRVQILDDELWEGHDVSVQWLKKLFLLLGSKLSTMIILVQSRYKHFQSQAKVPKRGYLPVRRSEGYKRRSRSNSKADISEAIQKAQKSQYERHFVKPKKGDHSKNAQIIRRSKSTITAYNHFKQLLYTTPPLQGTSSILVTHRNSNNIWADQPKRLPTIVNRKATSTPRIRGFETELQKHFNKVDRQLQTFSSITRNQLYNSQSSDTLTKMYSDKIRKVQRFREKDKNDEQYKLEVFRKSQEQELDGPAVPVGRSRTLRKSLIGPSAIPTDLIL